MDALNFWLNGREWRLHDLPPTTTLLRFLRDRAQLTGTKEGCAEGDCGACTVAVLEQTVDGRATYRAVNACLLLLPMLQGKQVFTVEGLGAASKPHPAQEMLAEKMGSQCGYCTPGVVMSLFEACYRTDVDAAWKVDGQMCGNLCRCTGYRPIREAARAISGLAPQDPFQARKARPLALQMGLRYHHGAQRYSVPESLEELWRELGRTPVPRVVCGGTDLSLEVTKRYLEPEALVSVEALVELRGLTETAAGFSIGAAVCLSELEDFFQERLVPVGRMLRYFGARQIKNRATVGGNLCTASPIGDLAPVFLSLDARFILLSREGERSVAAADFFLSYRKTALLPAEVLARVEIPHPTPSLRMGAYKVSKRRELDISTVSAAFAVEVGEDGRVRSARLAFGGMAATPARARRLERALQGQPWSEAVLRQVAPSALREDFEPLSDHRGSAAYRARLAENLLVGFFVETALEPAPRLEHPHTSTLRAAGQ